jgi:hypothetical protein
MPFFTDKSSYEVDPAKVAPEDRIDENFCNVLRRVSELLDALEKNIAQLPPVIGFTCAVCAEMRERESVCVCLLHLQNLRVFCYVVLCCLVLSCVVLCCVACMFVC